LDKSYIPITGKTIKSSGKPSEVSTAKSNAATSIKDQIRVLLTNGGDILFRWGEHFKDHLNLVILTPSNTQKVLSGKKNAITVTEVSRAVETFKLGRLQVVMKPHLKYLKP